MRAVTLLLVLVLFSGCTTPRLETPLEKLEPFVVYPEASVYRLLASPKELEGARLRTHGVTQFIHDGSGAYLYASRHDAEEGLPFNRIELRFSDALSSRPWFQHFAKQKTLFTGWVVGVYKTTAEPQYRILLEDVTEFDVRSD